MKRLVGTVTLMSAAMPCVSDGCDQQIACMGLGVYGHICRAVLPAMAPSCTHCAPCRACSGAVKSQEHRSGKHLKHDAQNEATRRVLTKEGNVRHNPYR